MSNKLRSHLRSNFICRAFCASNVRNRAVCAPIPGQSPCLAATATSKNDSLLDLPLSSSLSRVDWLHSEPSKERTRLKFGKLRRTYCWLWMPILQSERRAWACSRPGKETPAPSRSTDRVVTGSGMAFDCGYARTSTKPGVSSCYFWYCSRCSEKFPRIATWMSGASDWTLWWRSCGPWQCQPMIPLSRPAGSWSILSRSGSWLISLHRLACAVRRWFFRASVVKLK